MRTAAITEKVYYIGVNDRTTHKFEGLWPLPLGVSYNSYLAVGSERVAIIDGVEVAHALEQIDEIKAIIGDRKPDYLVINHMEPDHSGAIRILRSAFPEITIVGNARTLAMVKGYYGIDINTLQVKEGDTLPLGADCTLNFILTPMVHWPETMMTLLVEDGTLFSGDAFGCFGALNGAVLDTDMDCSRYMPEMVRYYSNIVGKYGMPVQKALSKLAGKDISTICTTHGPVWRSMLAEVVDMTGKLSRYEALDSGVTIVYGSMYGNTAHMAEAAAEALAEAGVRDIAVHNASVSELSYILADIFRHRGLIILSPTYSDGIFPPVEAVLRAMATRGVRGREIAVVGSCSWAEKASAGITGILESAGIASDIKPVTMQYAPDADAIEQCMAAATALAERLK
ncbi:MAG: FprA family A-type flavoprotein [Muribaculaceae bacterium]|nr:FprA family A-type flavoprotein [Muribaculaceae bacterium]